MSNLISESASTQPESQKYSSLGIVSLIFFLTSIIIILILIIALIVPVIPEDSPVLTYSIFSFICGIGPLSLSGIIFGIWSLAKPHKSNLFGIIGIIMNVLMMIIYCVSTAFFIIFGFGMMVLFGGI